MVAAWVGYAVAAGLVAAYLLVLVALHRAGRLGPNRALTLFGPFLMTKTQRGRSLLDRWGRFRRAWSAMGDLGLVLAATAMVSIVVVLAIEAVLAARIPSSEAPSVTEALGLPGINPFIPLGYGLVAIVVGIVIHELFHGIVARSQNIAVKSLGILWFVVPVGAFVEQDDQEMMRASRRARGRVAAAGILANFLIALLCFALLAVAVSGTVHPAATGVGVAVVEADTPAGNLSMRAGDIITAINGTPTTTNAVFYALLEASHARERISIDFYSASAGRLIATTTTLAPYPGDPTRGFLGVAPTTLTPSALVTTIATPWASPLGAFSGFVYWVILPPAGLEPVAGSTLGFFHLSGPLAGVGSGGFWLAANLLYWLAWMNLLLGLSNGLPLIPLDGNLLFRDWTEAIAHRVKRGWSAAQLESFSGRMTVVASLVIVLLLLWQFVAPHLNS